MARGLSKIGETVREITTGTVLLAMVVGFIGLGCLYLGLSVSIWSGREGIRAVVVNLGALLIGTVPIQLIWEWYGKRAFRSDILSTSKMLSEIDTTGLSFIGDFRDIDFSQLIRRSSHIEIHVAYAQTWRNVNIPYLREFSARKGTTLRVILPDPFDEITMHALCVRFGYSEQDLQKLIIQAADTYSAMSSLGSKVDVMYAPQVPSISCYRFDKVVIFSVYSLAKVRGFIPAVQAVQGGTLYEWVTSELDSLARLSRPYSNEAEKREKSDTEIAI